MEIYNLYPGSFGANCYILISGSHATVIDPSASTEGVINFLQKKNATLDCIILTHGHFDHMLSADTLRRDTGAPLLIHESDADFLLDGDKNAFKTFFGRDRKFSPAEKTLKHGDKISIGSESLTVLNTPGHTDGCICLLGDGILITGDTLFAESIGRCDLYSGDVRKMRESLKFLRTLDPTLKIYPGHGDESTLGHALDIVSYYF